MTIEITAQNILLAASLIGALVAIIGYGNKVYGWFHKQNKQDDRIDKLEKHHEDDMKSLKNEMTLIMYGVLASLKGLKERGCNGPVTEAIDKIDKYLNQKAHE